MEYIIIMIFKNHITNWLLRSVFECVLFLFWSKKELNLTHGLFFYQCHEIMSTQLLFLLLVFHSFCISKSSHICALCCCYDVIWSTLGQPYQQGCNGPFILSWAYNLHLSSLILVHNLLLPQYLCCHCSAYCTLFPPTPPTWVYTHTETFIRCSFPFDYAVCLVFFFFHSGPSFPIEFHLFLGFLL